MLIDSLLAIGSRIKRLCKTFINKTGRIGQILIFWLLQQKSILERKLPEKLKMAIAKKIENNLFSRVHRPPTDV